MRHPGIHKNLLRSLGIALAAAFLCCVRAGAVDPANVYPRLISPNGDGVNDFVFFVLENKTGAQTKGTIYNSQMFKVSEVRESSLFILDRSILVWDGKDESGSVVSAGIYIYKVQVGDEAYTGTVGVVR